MFNYLIDLFKRADINLPKEHPYNAVEDMCRNGDIGYIDAQGMESVSLDKHSLSLLKPILIDKLGRFTLIKPETRDDKELIVVNIHRMNSCISYDEILEKDQYLRIIPSTGKHEKVDYPKTRWDKILSTIKETGVPVEEYPGFDSDEIVDIESYHKVKIPFDQLYWEKRIPSDHHKTTLVALYGVQFLFVHKFGEYKKVYCINRLKEDLRPIDALEILRTLLEEKFPIDPSLYNMYDMQFLEESREETRTRELENYS